ncbi:MAG: polyprenol monophosphomannose synthase [Planctomycetota bacterium]
MSRSSPLIVVPTLSEAETIPTLLERLMALEPEVDVLVVDDDSPDGTADVVDEFGRAAAGRVRALRRTGPRGLGPAYVEGFLRGIEDGYDRLVQMDADLSHDPDRVPALLKGLDRADLVLGSRYARGGGTTDWSAVRRLVSRSGSFYSSLVLCLSIGDLTGGFKAWRRECLQSIGLTRVRSNGYCFQVEMTYRAVRRGARVAESPIMFRDRRVGESKMSKKIFLEAAWRVPLMRFVLP